MKPLNGCVGFLGGKMSRRDKLLLMTTWHPIFTSYDPAKSRRSFMLHIRKAVRIALGQKAERLPDILYNPSVKEADQVFTTWQDGFACDIETPSLKDHRMLSVAVSGEIDLAMVWDLRDVKTRKLMKSLKQQKLSKDSSTSTATEPTSIKLDCDTS